MTHNIQTCFIQLIQVPHVDRQQKKGNYFGVGEILRNFGSPQRWIEFVGKDIFNCNDAHVER